GPTTDAVAKGLTAGHATTKLSGPYPSTGRAAKARAAASQTSSRSRFAVIENTLPTRAPSGVPEMVIADPAIASASPTPTLARLLGVEPRSRRNKMGTTIIALTRPSNVPRVATMPSTITIPQASRAAPTRIGHRHLPA